MKITAFGDHAALAHCSGVAEVLALTAELDRDVPAGVIDVVPAERSVLVTFDPAVVTHDGLAAWLTAAHGCLGAADAAADRRADGSDLVEIPVRYDGADLAEVAELAGLAGPDEVIARHTAAEYVVAFTGFAPGFGYLVGGDPALRVPRRGSPRPRVPAGSVAIAGDYSGIYPRESPGGWHLLGRTAVTLWDSASDPPALLSPGTRVRFRRSDELPRPDPRPADADRPTPTHPALEVVAAGPLTTVQDLGRPGLARLGVPSSGAADRAAARLANRLVGNSDDAACLEITMGGVELRALRTITVAVTGATTTFTGAAPAVAMNAPTSLVAGTSIALGTPRHGVRTYLAVRGGVDASPELGSRATDTLSGLGPQVLRAGDVIGAGTAGLHAPLVDIAPVAPRPERPVRVHAGPGAELEPAALPALVAARWRVGADSNRVALRLDGPPVPAVAQPIPSHGLVRGAIQIPPDGRPVVFLADHPATGGYPVIAVAADDDLDALAQLRPGAELDFTTPAVRTGANFR